MPESRATAWNRLRYTWWSSFYDLFVRFGRQRRRAVELLSLQPGERALIVGAGTGADLPFLPPGVETLATDLTRVLEDLLAAAAVPLAIEHDEPAGLGGAFRIVVLRKERPPRDHGA